MTSNDEPVFAVSESAGDALAAWVPDDAPRDAQAAKAAVTILLRIVGSPPEQQAAAASRSCAQVAADLPAESAVRLPQELALAGALLLELLSDASARPVEQIMGDLSA